MRLCAAAAYRRQLVVFYFFFEAILYKHFCLEPVYFHTHEKKRRAIHIKFHPRLNIKISIRRTQLLTTRAPEQPHATTLRQASSLKWIIFCCFVNSYFICARGNKRLQIYNRVLL